MKNILLIGVGGTGSKAADAFTQKLSPKDRKNVKVLVFDTDESDIKKIEGAIPVKMADNASVGAVCDRIGHQYLREWFPSDDNNVRAQEMVRGASQWRKKSYLAFLNLMQKPSRRASFIGALEEMAVDPSAVCEIYVVSSLAGGTGSGSFIPIALYAKKYLREKMGKNPIVNAMLALPDIYADSQSPDNRVKIYANAYAILRELNAINLVGRGYNRGRTTRKKAPISLKIGDEKEPWVGLLFDSTDERFWTPEATPFTQVFLLDRIPQYSIPAHETVLANSLYTMLCTQTGAEIESVLSNQETALSQNNGANAVYAGFATSQMRFPTETILNYLAHSKALETCNDDWIFLHKETENKIQDKQQQEKQAGRRYIMKDGEYAQIFLESVNAVIDQGSPLTEVFERGTMRYDTNRKAFDRVDDYMKYLENAMSKAVQCKITEKAMEDVFQTKSDDNNSFNPFENEKKKEGQKSRVLEDFRQVYDAINKQYKQIVETVRTSASSFSDGAISFDEARRQAYKDSQFSIEGKLLMKDGKYVHPIAAMVLLCRLKDKLTEKLSGWDDSKKWADLSRRDVKSIPDSMLTVEEADSKKSWFADLGQNRIKALASEEKDKTEEYFAAKTKPINDWTQMRDDFNSVISKLETNAKTQLYMLVYSRLSASIDLLIEKYKAFFTRFPKERLVLVSETKTALVRDSGIIDSIINVYSTEEDKKAIEKMISRSGGPATEEELIETDDICGSGVFDSVFRAAVAVKEQDQEFNEKDSSTYRNLFHGLVEAYKKFISKTDAFDIVQSYDVIQAIVESCGGKDADRSRIESKMKTFFELALDKSKSQLMIDRTKTEIDPVDVTVFMVSRDTGRYIKQNAELFGLRVPADQVNERKAIYLCTQSFLEKMSGISCRIIISESLKGNMLYCTGETMNITPLAVKKINEASDNAQYYLYYKQAVKNAQIYNTDLWNPHLGFDWDKRGHLPFMNPSMEQVCDDKMIKALLYALIKKELILQASSAGRNNYTFRRRVNGVNEQLKIDGIAIDNNNIAMLLHWMRSVDEDIINRWSAAFDKEIAQQKDKLKPVISGSDQEITNLKTSLTTCEFMQWMTTSLYKDPSYENADYVHIDYGNNKVKDGPSILEFAWMIKNSEEASGLDCDDAERVLKVAYDVFMDMCTYRLPLDVRSEEFMRVYSWELDKVFAGFATTRIAFQHKENVRPFFRTVVNWVNGSGYFKDVNPAKPFDEHGQLLIDKIYEFNDRPGDTTGAAKDKYSLIWLFCMIESNRKNMRTAGKNGSSDDDDDTDAVIRSSETAAADDAE